MVIGAVDDDDSNAADTFSARYLMERLSKKRLLIAIVIGALVQEL